MLIDVIVASVFAMIMGGTETALIATGPIGLIIGAILGLIVAVIGLEAADKKLRTMNLPKGVRKLFSENASTPASSASRKTSRSRYSTA